MVSASPLEGRRHGDIEDVSERRGVDPVRTDFVANISHELKTPIGALSVLAETLSEEEDLGRRTPSPAEWSTRLTVRHARSTT